MKNWTNGVGEETEETKGVFEFSLVQFSLVCVYNKRSVDGEQDVPESNLISK